MDPKELRELCERVLAPHYCINDASHTLATACLQLLDQCDAMRGVVDAARYYVRGPHGSQGSDERFSNLAGKLAKLEERT